MRAEVANLAHWHGNTSRWRSAPAPSRPCLVAIGGFSGTGKSTLALGLAPSVGAVPGAVVIRSDVIRKRLFGVSPLDRLGPEGYSSNVGPRVHDDGRARERHNSSRAQCNRRAVYCGPLTGRP